MSKFLTRLFIVCWLCIPASLISADQQEQQHDHDPALVGAWAASSSSELASLSFEDTGKFTLDQRSATSLERQYMCGTWERNGSAVDLAVKAQKNRYANGQIEQAVSESRGQFTVIRATSNTLVLRIDSRVFSFHRTS
ncbi:MAG: hypothetical protein AB8G18_18450 [Gammaproteobacteria bacterium]